MSGPNFMTETERRARLAWGDARALQLSMSPLADNAARLLFALRALLALSLQSGAALERDSAVTEARAAILAAQGGRVLP